MATNYLSAKKYDNKGRLIRKSRVTQKPTRWLAKIYTYWLLQENDQECFGLWNKTHICSALYIGYVGVCVILDSEVTIRVSLAKVCYVWFRIFLNWLISMFAYEHFNFTYAHIYTCTFSDMFSKIFLLIVLKLVF